MLFQLKKSAYKRKTVRKRAKCPVAITPISVKAKEASDPNTYGINLCKDISPDGMRILTLVPFTPGDKIKISFSLNSFSKQLALKAQVKNVMRESRNGFSCLAVGVEFFNITEKEKRYLSAILDLYSK
ncbi:PilZ domain-containing protein [Bdellovibrionota bacterium FG-1]